MSSKELVTESKASLSRRGFIAGTGALAGLAVVGSATSALAEEASSSASKQVFSATEPSIKGDIQIFVTMDGDTISAVDVFDDVDTTVIRDVAIESICSRVVEQQNIEVDTVAGATMTSLAILNGIADALASGGIDTTPYEKGSDAVATKSQAPDEEYDVVVVGSGMAGLTAADTVARNGASVLVLEKLAYCGGSSRVCGGGLWAMGADANEIIGQDCSAEDYISFMSDWSAPAQLNTDLMNNIHDISGETFDYIYNWGLPVTASGWSLGNPDAELPVFWSTAAVGANWETGESGIIDFMATRATQDGAEIRLCSKVTGVDVENGAVTGVEVEDLENTYTVKTTKVILASGGFTRNTELIEEYAPDYVNAFAFTGAGSTGDGLIIGRDLGAAVVGNGMMGLSGMNPSFGYYGRFGNLVNSSQITVNSQGELFGMETAFYGNTLKLLLDQDGSCGYGICDGTNATVDRLNAAVEAGYVTCYQTLEELAEGEGIDATAFVATAEEAGVTEPPFYCVIRRPLFIGSIPGLKVNECCAVVDEDDNVVADGLFAAGEILFGNVFCNAYPCSGTGMGTSCYTGAIAASAALA